MGLALLTHNRMCPALPHHHSMYALPHTPPHQPLSRLFPAFQNIRAISKILTAHVAQHMVQVGLGTCPPGCTNWEDYVAANMWTADQL